MNTTDPSTRIRRRVWATGVLLTAVLAALAVACSVDPAAADPNPTPAPPPGATPAPGPGPSSPPSGALSSSPAPGIGVPSLPPAPTPDPGEGDPAWYDLEGQIQQAISGFLAWAVGTALNPALRALGESVLATPDLTGDYRVRQVWTGSLVVTNAVFVLLIMAGGFVIATSGGTSSPHGLREIAPRLAFAALAANLSLLVVGKAITATNALTAAIAGRGVDPATASAAVKEITSKAMQNESFLHSVLSLGLVVMAIVVVITFILRVMLLVALTGLAPLALACHALPQTEQLAYTWWRSLAACLAIQLGQTIVLVAGIRVFLTPSGDTVFGVPSTSGGLLGLLICLTMLWLLVKVPLWTKQYVLAGLTRQRGPGLFRQIVGTLIAVKTLGGLNRVLPRSWTRVHHARRAAHPTSALTGRVTPRRPQTRRRPVKPAKATAAVRPTRAAGPAEFTHAPLGHTPLPAPAGRAEAPEFTDRSRADRPTRIGTAAAGLPPSPVRFTDRPARQQPSTPPATRTAPPVRFSPPPATPTPVVTPRPAPAPQPVRFTHAAAPQSAPKRPPAPVTPVFSHQPATAKPRGKQRRGSTGKNR